MTFSKLGLVWAIGAAALAFATPAFADTTVGPLKFDAQSLRVEDLQGTLDRLDAADVELIDKAPRHGLSGMIAFLHPRATRGVLVELVDRDSVRR